MHLLVIDASFARILWSFISKKIRTLSCNRIFKYNIGYYTFMRVYSIVSIQTRQPPTWEGHRWNACTLQYKIPGANWACEHEQYYLHFEADWPVLKPWTLTFMLLSSFFTLCKKISMWQANESMLLSYVYVLGLGKEMGKLKWWFLEYNHLLLSET